MAHIGIQEMVNYSRFYYAYISEYTDHWHKSMADNPLQIRDMRLEIPAGKYEYLSLKKRIENSLLDFFLLIGWSVLLFLVAYGVWVRKQEV